MKQQQFNCFDLFVAEEKKKESRRRGEEEPKGKKIVVGGRRDRAREATMAAEITPKRERRMTETAAGERATGDPGVDPGHRTTGRVGPEELTLSPSARTPTETTISLVKPASHSMTTISSRAKSIMI